MPKLKTNSSAKKRFKITATGKVKYKQCGKRHNLSKKGKSRIRKLRKSSILSKSNAVGILVYRMPYSK